MAVSGVLRGVAGDGGVSETCMRVGRVALAVAVAVKASRWVLNRVQYVGEHEQLLLKKLTEKVVIGGPRVYFPSPFTTLNYTKRKGVVLTTTQYLVVVDEKSGDKKNVRGPTVYFLGPYESADSPKDALVLTSTDGAVVENHETGEVRLVRGPAQLVPEPNEVVLRTTKAIALRKDQFIRLADTATGHAWVVKGEDLVWLEPKWVVRSRNEKPEQAYTLGSNDMVRLRDTQTGTVRAEYGPKLVFPSVSEELYDGGTTKRIDLREWEYCTIKDLTTGEVRVERGEQKIWLRPTEKLQEANKQEAVRVDTEHAALILNNATGEQRLVDTPQLYFPKPHEEVLEVRPLIRLADHEAMVLKDADGKYHYRYGDPKKSELAGTDRSFFLPPYWEIVTLCWSRGRRRERRDLQIQTFDMRPQYMSFEFNCRTSDNVEMILEGTFFWEVVSLPDMLQYTGDAPGDVCAHARSCFIQLISKVTLQTFMDTFNQIALEAHSSHGHDTFYTQRGIKIHALEVTRYQCADQSTRDILEQIITETTNRMNRLSCQESENEVALAKLRGLVDQEKAKTEVLEITHQHAIETARAEGTAEAERCVSFLQSVRKEGGASGQDELYSQKLAEDMWRVLRKNDALSSVSNGNAHVVFAPADANLSFDNQLVPVKAK